MTSVADELQECYDALDSSKYAVPEMSKVVSQYADLPEYLRKFCALMESDK